MLKAMSEEGFLAIRGGVDLKGDCHFGQSSGFYPGVRHEHRKDPVRPAHGLLTWIETIR